ncbi:excinuclease ABC subunit B, partial [Candidatus Beckwithbacteria bacterium CG10_big_fil_rev_8_21_14_0_10_34_10]
HLEGEVILYANTKSPAMIQAIKEVERRRRKQFNYNKKHKITPKSIKKNIRPKLIIEEEQKEEKEIDYHQLTPQDKKKLIKKLEKEMRTQARELNFEKAANLRDKIKKIEKNF